MASTEPTPAPVPTKEELIKAAYESLQSAASAGVTRAILGMSVDALRILLDGKPMQGPLTELWLELELEDGERACVTAPTFCDPGLEGFSVYAIAWPEKPEPKLKVVSDFKWPKKGGSK